MPWPPTAAAGSSRHTFQGHFVAEFPALWIRSLRGGLCVPQQAFLGIWLEVALRRARVSGERPQKTRLVSFKMGPRCPNFSKIHSM